MKRNWGKTLVWVGIWVVTFILFVCAVKLVSVFSDARKDLSNSKPRREVIQSTEGRETVELVEEGSTELFQNVKNVYNTNEDVKEDVKSFLGDQYDRYSGVISMIESSSDAIFDSMSDVKGYDPENSTMIGKAFTENIGLENGMQGISSFFIENSITVIDFFDDTRVIYAYDYPTNEYNELVVVDYKDIKKITTSLDVMELGDVRSVSGVVENCKIQKFGDFYVLFIKG